MAADLSIRINASFKVDSTIYTANMALPSSAPTGDDPFVFIVTSASEKTPTATTPLLTVAVGATSEVYVAVSPPTDLIKEAVGTDIVQKLDVVVSEGNYDTGKQKFLPS